MGSPDRGECPYCYFKRDSLGGRPAWLWVRCDLAIAVQPVVELGSATDGTEGTTEPLPIAAVPVTAVELDLGGSGEAGVTAVLTDGTLRASSGHVEGPSVEKEE
jgi:hypothetical protein